MDTGFKMELSFIIHHQNPALTGWCSIIYDNKFLNARNDKRCQGNGPFDVDILTNTGFFAKQVSVKIIYTAEYNRNIGKKPIAS